MRHLLNFSVSRLIAVAAIAFAAPLSVAHAGGDVNWSLSIGTPWPAPIYAPPPVVYVQPQPVYVRPAPIYVQPATVVQYGQPYYVEEVPYWKHNRGHGHWKRHGHHYGD